MNAPDRAVHLSRRERESEYWDKVAEHVFSGKGVSANIHKVEQVVGRILRWASMIDQDVLEVGTGCGLTAAVLNMACLGRWRYTGTDTSQVFIDGLKKTFPLKVVKADITSLPGEDGQYSRILCLDSLEHVHPDDRPQGYAELARVAADHAVLLINMPLWQGFHEPEFDHPFGPADFAMLEAAGFELRHFDAYAVPNPGKARPSGFVVMERIR